MKKGMIVLLALGAIEVWVGAWMMFRSEEKTEITFPKEMEEIQ